MADVERIWRYGCVICGYQRPNLTLRELTQVTDAHMTVQHPREHAATRQGASRQALDSTQTTTPEAQHHIESLGVAISVRQLTPASAGYAVRIVSESPIWLDPKDAHLDRKSVV